MTKYIIAQSKHADSASNSFANPMRFFLYLTVEQVPPTFGICGTRYADSPKEAAELHAKGAGIEYLSIHVEQSEQHKLKNIWLIEYQPVETPDDGWQYAPKRGEREYGIY